MSVAPPESVWDYPRPPRLESSPALIVIELGGQRLVETRKALRVLETSHPPVYYVSFGDIADGVLQPVRKRSFCEFKGDAAYFDVVGGDQRRRAAAWHYPEPVPSYASIRGHVAFYPSAMDLCSVDGEPVVAQDGDFYGGWITSAIRGPFKGAPGTLGW